MNNNIFILFILVTIFLVLWKYVTNISSRSSAPFVGTEPKIVKRMLDIADLKKGDVLYDLGSGDGRIVVAAALRGANSVGIELDPLKVLYSRLFIYILKLRKQAKIVRGNFFEKNLSNSDVVTLFLLHDTNQKLKNKLKKELKKGARIVSYFYVIEDWKPDKVYFNIDSNRVPIYLYKV